MTYAPSSCTFWIRHCKLTPINPIIFKQHAYFNCIYCAKYWLFHRYKLMTIRLKCSLPWSGWRRWISVLSFFKSLGQTSSDWCGNKWLVWRVPSSVWSTLMSFFSSPYLPCAVPGRSNHTLPRTTLAALCSKVTARIACRQTPYKATSLDHERRPSNHGSTLG